MKRPNSAGNVSVTKAVGYARVSTPEQAEKDLSLPAQMAAIRKYAQDHGLELVGEFVERGITATDDNRPEFRRMLQEIYRPTSQVGSIIVTHGSRFMRNATKARIHKEALRKRGIRVVAIQQEVTDDPNGRFAEGVFELIDQLESETNGVRTRAGMSENARQGFFNGSKSPFGFRVEKVATPGGSKNKLAVDASEVELLREVFQRYLAGSGAKATAIGLNQRGLLYRGKRWTRDLVLKVIGDSCAVGKYYWGRLDSRGKRLRSEDQWIEVAVERIVDDETFRLVQELRERRDPGRSAGRLPSSPLLLAGLLRCAQCGGPYQLETSGKLGPDGQAYRYYNCRRFIRTGKEACAGHRIPVATLDRAVLTHAAEQFFSDRRCREFLDNLVEEEGLLRQKTAEQRRLLERARDELGKRLERWFERIETEPELADVGAERLRELKAKRDEVVQALAKLRPLFRVPPYLYKPETIEGFQSRVRAALSSDDWGVRRVYLQNLIDHIVVGEESIVLEVRAGAALAMMAASRPASVESTGGEVLPDVVDWHARRDSNP
jgi:site-specific DNA recombinase